MNVPSCNSSAARRRGIRCSSPVLGLKLSGIQRRLHGQNIVERRHDKAAARHQRDAEVLGMPIGRADQPEKVGRATRYDLDDYLSVKYLCFGEID